MSALLLQMAQIKPLLEVKDEGMAVLHFQKETITV